MSNPKEVPIRGFRITNATVTVYHWTGGTIVLSLTRTTGDNPGTTCVWTTPQELRDLAQGLLDVVNNGLGEVR